MTYDGIIVRYQIGQLDLQFSSTAAQFSFDIPQVLIQALVVQIFAHHKDIIAPVVTHRLSLTRKLKYTITDCFRPSLEPYAITIDL